MTFLHLRLWNNNIEGHGTVLLSSALNQLVNLTTLKLRIEDNYVGK